MRKRLVIEIVQKGVFFSRNCASNDTTQIRTNIENPFDENIYDIGKNNMLKTQPNPTVDDEVRSSKVLCHFCVFSLNSF
jgi:hypothetical protein